MEKGRKAAIKKLVADLHEKRKGNESGKGAQAIPEQGSKGFTGTRKAGTYRPKV